MVRLSLTARCLATTAVLLYAISPACATATRDAVGLRLMEPFLGRLGFKHLVAVPPAPPSPVKFVSTKQDWGVLSIDRNCATHEQLRIGSRTYEKGLGTHANGETVFSLDGRYTRFTASAGVDRNGATSVGRSSVVFFIRADGREVFRSSVRRFVDEPVKVDIPIAGARRLELCQSDAGDGIGWDVCDWADARLVERSGRETYLSDMVPPSGTSSFLTKDRIPASFIYGGKHSDELLKSWPSEEALPVRLRDRVVHARTWREPGGGLVATWRVEVLRDEPAVEFRWVFANEGTRPSGILSDVMALDLTTDIEPMQARLIHSTGGLVGRLDKLCVLSEPVAFATSETTLGDSDFLDAGGTVLRDVKLSAGRGRSSNKDLPFFVVHDTRSRGGLCLGIGWSGQWEAGFSFSNPEKRLRMSACMPDTRLALPPGETIVSPSVLLGAYQGDSQTGCNTLRRILRNHYTPTIDGKKIDPPVMWCSWFSFTNNINEQGLKQQADLAAQLGIEYFEIDSGWFDGAFPSGIGSWTVDSAKFPNGLGPIGKYVRSKGMKLGLWFEPGSAYPGTKLLKEHPEWVSGILVNLGIREAREWVLAAMDKQIDEAGVEWLRLDFNQDPLAQWKSMDSPDTQGLSQIRFTMGMYEMLDRLHAEHPSMLIDGCASGGRRMDLEMLKRCHVFWKSDETAHLPTMRAHETGGNMLLPGGLLNANLMEIRSKADLHSLFGGPLGFAADLTKVAPDKLRMARAEVDEYKKLRPLLNKDYYPLFGIGSQLDDTAWTGWQFHDPDTGDGVFVVIRPEGSSYRSTSVRLRGLSPGMAYEVAPIGSPKPRQVSSMSLLNGWQVDLPEPGTSAVYRYRPYGVRRLDVALSPTLAE